ncbi:ATP-binding protein [Nitratifractor sp.]
MSSDTKAIYEKAGLFYLGKDVDKETFEPTDILTLLKNKNFTTHAAIIGMTGSGKTGLGIGILEEAAIDNIPAIVIDPKGDMGDLCLTDPQFRPERFEPWVADEARAKGVDPAEYARSVAQTWKEGIESWDQDAGRVERFARVAKTIYTPGSQAGVSVNLLGSLDAPPEAIMQNADDFAAYLKSTASSLLALMGIEADPLESREFILLSQILSRAWGKGESLSIETLVGRILKPPFAKVGVLPLESFYPEKERFGFANRFNALLASPGFVNWLTGEPLEIDRLLYDAEGKAKISIFTISHLSEEERMFFVTLLLNRLIAWMRRQSGASRLRALLYMDEIYGFFPPVKNPPSKEPMITLLKQARAYGLGVVLSTQNPVDLDYKGLSNIGTWFIGRLQTTQDIERVIDGLGGKVGSQFERKEIATLLANLKKRVFFLKSAHLDDIRLFGTRWVLSYLKGPLSKEEISNLMASQKASVTRQAVSAASPSVSGECEALPVLDPSILQRFEPEPTGRNRFRPTLAARAKVGYHDQRRGIDRVEELCTILDLEGCEDADWDRAEEEDLAFERFPATAPEGACGRAVPPFVVADRGLTGAASALREHLYRERRLAMFRCRKLKLESEPGEDEGTFRARVEDRIRELNEEALEELKERYAKKEARLEERLKRAMDRVEKEKSDQASSIISVGASILSALFGGRGPSASKIGTAINRGGRVLRERGDLSRAQQRLEEIRDQIEALEEELEEKIDELDTRYDIENYPIESFSIRPKKSAIEIESIVLLWRPDF